MLERHDEGEEWTRPTRGLAMSSPSSTSMPHLDAPAPHAENEAPNIKPPTVARLAETLRVRDGRIVTLRAIQPDDAERLQAFHRRLTPDTVIYRFFHYMPELSAEEAYWFTHLDYDQRMAFVVTSPAEGDASGEAIHAVGRYESLGSERAEVAFVVEDAWQGSGLASTLLRRLASFARDRGLTTFVAVTMGSNIRMQNVFRHSGFPCKMRYDEGEIAVTLDVSQEPGAELR